MAVLEYVGYDKKQNEKWIVTEGWNGFTYVAYQEDEFTQRIYGYVIPNVIHKSNRYKAFNCTESNVEYFDSKEAAIEYIKLWRN